MSKDFFVVNGLVKRVLIPPKTSNTNFKGLNLWIGQSSRFGSEINTLCLIEDNHIDDDDYRSLEQVSNYSSFSVFLEDMSDELYKSVVANNYLSCSIGSENEIDFHKDPLSFLGKLGARVYPQRNIQSLYRKRVCSGKMFEEPNWDDDIDTIKNPYEEFHYTVTIGYPIWIMGD